MGFRKDNKDKEFHCRQCAGFFDSDELENGSCPECGTDEDLFMNEDEDE